MHRTRTMTLLTIGALSVAALTGCSGEQSVADACSSSNTVVESTLNEASTTLQTELSAANYNTVELGDDLDGCDAGGGGLGPVAVAGAFDVPSGVFAFDDAGVGAGLAFG
ncbi:hypothetical protein [Microbacterium sp.]|uniref:hypothetical protein n=1 Tax=Microbacterium sp. TaxID=51671 RepID=UPI003A889F10